jgi:hypothetical protein
VYVVPKWIAQTGIYRALLNSGHHRLPAVNGDRNTWSTRISEMPNGRYSFSGEGLCDERPMT